MLNLNENYLETKKKIDSTKEETIEELRKKKKVYNQVVLKKNTCWW